MAVIEKGGKRIPSIIPGKGAQNRIGMLQKITPVGIKCGEDGGDATLNCYIIGCFNKMRIRKSKNDLEKSAQK